MFLAFILITDKAISLIKSIVWYILPKQEFRIIPRLNYLPICYLTIALLQLFIFSCSEKMTALCSSF